MFLESPALVVVDMQRYYLESESSFAQFHSHLEPSCLDYIHERCDQTVIPNTLRLIAAFQEIKRPVLFLRLCGIREDRSDLHHTFARVHREAHQSGFPDLYPLRSDPYSNVAEALSTGLAEDEFCKTTYSAFTSAPAFEKRLRDEQCETLICAGLATSQCVETTARDAADRNFRIIQVEDAQADYSETTHRASLYSSQGVCGGQILETENLLRQLLR